MKRTFFIGRFGASLLVVLGLTLFGLNTVSHAEMIGAGIGILDLAGANNTFDTPSNGNSDQSRQNVDISFTAIFDPGVYFGSTWSYRAGQTGSVIPYIARSVGNKIYEILAVGEQIDIDDTGLDLDMTVPFGGAGFSLDSATELFAGIVNPTVAGSQNPIYTNLASGSQMDHDNNADGNLSPAVVGGTVDGFGHANLGRSYAFSIDVSNVDFLVGDVNDDEAVDLLDFEVILQNFFQTVTELSEGDVNFDGVVNFGDFHLWKSNRTDLAGASAIPEPTCLMLVPILASLCLMIRRQAR